MPPAPHHRYELEGMRVYVAGHQGMVGAALRRRPFVPGESLCEMLCSALAGPLEVA